MGYGCILEGLRFFERTDRMNPNTLQKYAMLLLCMSAGMVDLIGYLGLGHVLTANMTGNIVLLGIAIARAQEFVVLRSLLALMGFIAGISTTIRPFTCMGNFTAKQKLIVEEVTCPCSRGCSKVHFRILKLGLFKHIF